MTQHQRRAQSYQRRCQFSYSNCFRWLIFSTFLFVAWGADVQSTAAMGTVLWLSDVHLDLYYGTKDAAGSSKECRTSSTTDTASNSNEGNNEENTTALPVTPISTSTSLHALPTVGCDSSWDLVQEVFRHANETLLSQFSLGRLSSDANQRRIILVTGDISRHSTHRLSDPIGAVKTALQRVSGALLDYFPTQKKNEPFVDNDDDYEYYTIIPTLGNNDVTPDYFLDVQHPKDLLNVVAEGFDDLFESSLEKASFRTGGYFARNVSTTLTILSINTLLYSTSHIPSSKDVDPLGQFEWLEQQLSQAATSSVRSVWIVGHIPPAIGSYGHSQLWETRYLETYWSILDKYKSVITGHCFGHLHTDEFRWISTKSREWPLFLASSITPIYNSQPSWRALQYDQHTGKLFDYDTWYLELENTDNNEINDLDENNTVVVWKKAPSFQESFQVASLDEESMKNLMKRMIDDEKNDDLWEAFEKRRQLLNHSVKYSDDLNCDTACRRSWHCTWTTITKRGYNDCILQDMKKDGVPSWRGIFIAGQFVPVIFVVITALIIVLAIGGCLCFFGPGYLRRRKYERTDEINDADGVIVMDVYDGKDNDEKEDIPMELS